MKLIHGQTSITLRANIDNLLNIYKEESCYGEIQEYMNHMYVAVTLARFLSLRHEVPYDQPKLVEELLGDCDVIYTPEFHLYPRKTIDLIITTAQERVGAPTEVTLH